LGRLSAALASLLLASNLFAIPVWINEIHYDNASTDVGEFVEIAGEAGTDLAAHSLILYNGTNGTPYNPINLSGILPDDSNGFGISNAISFPTNGLQNGAPDGIALSGPGVLQFLSYEGSFTATNGVANGLTSADIGVAESSSTSIGHSLQLIGLGSDYADFTWSGPATASPGSINTGQTFPRESVPDNGATAWMLIIGLSGLAFVKRGKRRYF
jgi:hypothetical protein